jgi:hypothetical protein
VCSGYHQKCHVPAIPDEVLDPSEEWVCTYCEQEIPCPYVVNQDEVVSVLYTSPERKRSKVSNNEEEEESLKQKKRKLAALSPPRCSNGSVSAGDMKVCLPLPGCMCLHAYVCAFKHTGACTDTCVSDN